MAIHNGGRRTFKKRKSIEDKLNYFKNYDKKRKRQYNIDWEKTYDWLKDSSPNGMFCTVCTEYCDDRKRNSFITSCTSYKEDSVSKHQKTRNHEKALLLKKSKSERDSVTVSNSEAAKIIKVLNRENFEKLNIIVRYRSMN